MAIKELTVCDDKGKISEEEGEGVNKVEKLKGTLCPVAGELYRFYAGVPNDDGVSVSEKKIVQMVLPVGGDTSGLYRFPRVGERVLVEDGADNNYLLGYVPMNTAGMAFTAIAESGTQAEKAEKNEAEKKALTGDEQGMILRYKNTAARPDDAVRGINAPKYSEIGFYRKKYEPKNEPVSYPHELRLTSAGSAVQETEKDHAIHAKGIEILSGLDPNTKNVPGDPQELAVGDAVGETYALGDKDVQIRAAGEVVIKAGKKIVLQVGRSQITIDDTGIKLISKKINSN
jgi:hypothetical protein